MHLAPDALRYLTFIAIVIVTFTTTGYAAARRRRRRRGLADPDGRNRSLTMLVSCAILWVPALGLEIGIDIGTSIVLATLTTCFGLIAVSLPALLRSGDTSAGSLARPASAGADDTHSTTTPPR